MNQELEESKVFKGYVTGFFDGEGSTDITKDGKLRARISNTDYNVLRLFKSNFGGSLSPVKDRSLKSGEGNRKKMWIWSVADSDALKVLKYIREYSIEKKEQTDLGIVYMEKKRNCQGGNRGMPFEEVKKREWFRNEIKRLKQERYSEEEILNIEKEIQKFKDKKFISKISCDIIVGYCAGFFDGEGSVHIGVDKNLHYTLRVGIANTNFECLKIFREEFGGNLTPKTVLYDGAKPEWIWTQNSDFSTEFLKTVLPWCVVKKEQVKLAIEYLHMKTEPYCRKRGTPISELKLREEYRSRLHMLKGNSYKPVNAYVEIEDKGQRSLFDF